jgi:phosphinothricin acetyltransferase
MPGGPPPEDDALSASTEAHAMPLEIREIRLDDIPALTAIYNHYVRTSIATFAEQEITTAEFAAQVASVEAATLPWLVAVTGPDVVGYAYAALWKARSAYRFAVEISVYLSPGAEGRGTGSRLYADLLDRLRARGVHAAIGGVSLPNDTSVALHRKFGFEQVARFREVGFKFGQWIDVGYWELVLDDRVES